MAIESPAEADAAAEVEAEESPSSDGAPGAALPPVTPLVALQSEPTSPAARPLVAPRLAPSPPLVGTWRSPSTRRWSSPRSMSLLRLSSRAARASCCASTVLCCSVSSCPRSSIAHGGHCSSAPDGAAIGAAVPLVVATEASAVSGEGFAICHRASSRPRWQVLSAGGGNSNLYSNVASMSLTPYTRLATLATHSWPWHSQTLEVFEDHLIALSYFQDRGVLQRVFDVSSRNVL
eukprot:scaffold106170_cov69-Phaeocystis_antarctica.AAC.4